MFKKLSSAFLISASFLGAGIQSAAAIEAGLPAGRAWLLVEMGGGDHASAVVAAEKMLEELRDSGLAKKRDVPVKILGRGELSIALTVSAHKFSKSARAAIEGAGGTCKLADVEE